MIRSASIRVSVTITSTKSQKMIRVLKASRQPCSALDGVGTSVVVIISFMYIDVGRQPDRKTYMKYPQSNESGRTNQHLYPPEMAGYS